MRTEPDPKLVALREAIHTIMKEHDVCGAIILSGPDSAEYLVEVEASWSCAEFIRDKGGLGVRICTTYLDLGYEGRKKMLEETVGMILGQVSILEGLLGGFKKLEQVISEKLQVDHISKRV